MVVNAAEMSRYRRKTMETNSAVQVELFCWLVACFTSQHQAMSLWYGSCLFVRCLTSQQLANVSQVRIYSDNFTCCHTETEVADPTFYLTQSQYTDTGPTSPSADPITAGAWQGSHWSVSF